MCDHRETDDTSHTDTQEQSTTRYNIEFTFDTDVKCAITIYYFATEEISNKQVMYVNTNMFKLLDLNF